MTKINDYLQNTPPTVEAVLGLFVDVKNTKVLLGIREKSSNGLGVKKKAGIGGKLEYLPDGTKESREAAILRESLEEIGVKPTKYQYVGTVTYLNPTKPNFDMVVYEFVVTEWEGIPTKSEEITPVWYPIDSIPYEEMFRDNKYFMPNVLSGFNVDAVFLFGDINIEEAVINFEYNSELKELLSPAS